jgi:hypothetical protein
MDETVAKRDNAADWSISLLRKSSKLRVETNFSIRLQAFSTSNSSFFRLRCSIQRHLAFFNRFLEIWIVDYLDFYEIYRRVKKLLEPLNP